MQEKWERRRSGVGKNFACEDGFSRIKVIRGNSISDSRVCKYPEHPSTFKWKSSDLSFGRETLRNGATFKTRSGTSASEYRAVCRAVKGIQTPTNLLEVSRGGSNEDYREVAGGSGSNCCQSRVKDQYGRCGNGHLSSQRRVHIQSAEILSDGLQFLKTNITSHALVCTIYTFDLTSSV